MLFLQMDGGLQRIAEGGPAANRGGRERVTPIAHPPPSTSEKVACPLNSSNSSSSISILLLFVTINAVGNASAPCDEPAIDVDVVHDGKANATRVIERVDGTRVSWAIRALVEDQGDAFDRASRRDGRKRLGWVGSLEAHPRPLGRVLRSCDGLMVIGTPADERGRVIPIRLSIGHVEPRCTGAAVASVTIVEAQVKVGRHFNSRYPGDFGFCG